MKLEKSMIDALKTLENDVVTEEAPRQIEEAWKARFQQVVTAELREEFAQKYEHDKATMVSH